MYFSVTYKTVTITKLIGQEMIPDIVAINDNIVI